ncbi:MAG: hypothetical protein CM15mP127_09500 [Gammaproteobacteria bacterium]|nr:MAG: hypothetical protein CM15mP127_09500 [Gammaproteobacteria bacterium]
MSFDWSCALSNIKNSIPAIGDRVSGVVSLEQENRLVRNF